MCIRMRMSALHVGSNVYDEFIIFYNILEIGLLGLGIRLICKFNYCNIVCWC